MNYYDHMKTLFLLFFCILLGCDKTPAPKNTSFLGVNIGDSQEKVLEILSNPQRKYTSEDKTYESWYYPYKHSVFNRFEVSRDVTFQEANGKLKVDLLECKWDGPEVDEEGVLENLWNVMKPCEIQGVKIYSTESEVIKIFGQPKAKLLITDNSDSKTISSLIYDGMVFHLFKKRVFEIYVGATSSGSVGSASIFYKYPDELLKSEGVIGSNTVTTRSDKSNR
jgi:hypothetical protein